jgi:hypothetical protein
VNTCACGCGQPLTHVRQHRKDAAPVRFLHGHYARLHNTKKIDAARALELHNQGLTLRQIAAQFPGASRMAALRAIRRAQEGKK